MRVRRERQKGSLLLSVLVVALPAALLSLFVWRILVSGPSEGLTALAEGRVVTILLPSGEVQGGRAATTPIARVPMPEAEPDAAINTAPSNTPVQAQDTPLLPPPGEGLRAAPASPLLENSPLGPLPVVGPDGAKAWQYYAREFTRPGETPMVAVVVTGLGLSKQVTDAALRLPPSVSLSFSAYGSDVATWAGSARALGHEVLVDLPLEPVGYPLADPGPYGLLTGQSATLNQNNLRWVLSRFTGAIGGVAGIGERYTGNADAAADTLQSLAARGLMLVLGGKDLQPATQAVLDKARLPYVRAHALLPAEMPLDDVRTELLALEAAARRDGAALLVVSATPATLSLLSEWLQQFEQKGIILAPVSALARLKFS